MVKSLSHFNNLYYLYIFCICRVTFPLSIFIQVIDGLMVTEELTTKKISVGKVSINYKNLFNYMEPKSIYNFVRIYIKKPSRLTENYIVHFKVKSITNSFLHLAFLQFPG